MSKNRHTFKNDDDDSSAYSFARQKDAQMDAGGGFRGQKEALGGEHNAASLSDVSQMEEPIVT